MNELIAAYIQAIVNGEPYMMLEREIFRRLGI